MPDASRLDRRSIVTAVCVAAAAAVVLLAMGRVPICTCGHVELWHGAVNSPGNSQHISDPYTFTHVVHGFVFYALLWLAARRLTLGTRLVAAVGIESAWEILENTSVVINRYREATIALGYNGDSVINSVSDILAMTLGFLVAARLPTRAVVVLAIGMELVLAYWIRDNLTLNVVMLVYPIDAIRRWQMGA